MELAKLITYTRSLVAVALLKIEDRANYLERIMKIECLIEYEREIWGKLDKLYKETGTLTKADLIKFFGFNRLDDEVINKLVSSDVNDEIDIYIDNYENAMKKLELYNMFSNCKSCLVEGKTLDIDSLIDKVSEDVRTNNIVDNCLNQLKSIYEEEVDKTKISTCISAIDKLNASFRKGTVNAVMGYTGSYKTLYCTNVSYQAIINKLNVCYVSLEISKAEMYYNFLSRYSNETKFKTALSHTDMKFKELDSSSKEYLFDTLVPCFSEELSKHLVIIDETDFNSNSSSTFDNLFRSAERRFMETTGKGVDLVIVDHLNLLKFSDAKGMNDYSKVNHWMSYFRKNCKNFIRKHKQVCILVAVQCSREGYEKAKHNGGTYSLTGAAEGNEIERSSENVLAIYSDSSLKEEKLAKIQLIKGRNCGEMKEPILMSVNPKYYIVSDYDELSQETVDEDDVIDVSNIKTEISKENKNETMSYETLMEIPLNINSSQLNTPPEKLETLKQLGVNFFNEESPNQNQYQEDTVRM